MILIYSPHHARITGEDVTAPGRWYSIWVMRYRWWIIALSLATTAACGSGMRLLVFNDDNRIWFGTDNPWLVTFEALERTYIKSDNVFIAVAPHDGDVFTRATLASIAALTERSWQTPYSSRVDSLTNFQHTHAADDDFIVENLVREPLALSDADLARIRQIAVHEPTMVNRFISPAGDITGVNISVIRPGSSLDELARVTAFVREMLDELRAEYPSIEFYPSGTITVNTPP